MSFNIINIKVKARAKDKIKAISRDIFVLAIFVSILLGSLSFLTPNVRAEEDRRLLENIKDKEPQTVVTEELIKQDNNTLVSKQEDLELKFNLSEKKVEIKTDNGSNDNNGNSTNYSTNNSANNSITIQPPKADKIDTVRVIDDKVIYSGNNSPIDTVIEPVNGGVRQVINIKSKDAPSFYDFPLQVAQGDKVMLSFGSSVVIKDSTDKLKLIITQPWAKDSNNKELKTWYTLESDNTVLRQHIDLADAAFPVVADPLLCGGWIDKTEWAWERVYGRYEWSLKVTPTWCGRGVAATSGSGLTIMSMVANNLFIASPAWDEVVRKTPSHQAWDKKHGTSVYWSMYDQFICHLFNVFTAYKDVWRLDPWRPNVGWPAIYRYGCNPEN